MIPRILIALFVSAALALAQSGVSPELPPPPPPEGSPIGLLLLSFVLSLLCLPLSLLAFVVFLLLLVKLLGLFKITPAKLVAAIVQSGGVGTLKLMLWPLGLLITVPAALLATGWAANILDHRLGSNDRLVYGCAAGVLVAVVLIAFVKRLARGVQQKMMGGMIPGMSGMMGSKQQRGMKQAKPAGRSKRR